MALVVLKPMRIKAMAKGVQSSTAFYVNKTAAGGDFVVAGGFFVLASLGPTLLRGFYQCLAAGTPVSQPALAQLESFCGWYRAAVFMWCARPSAR